MTLFVRTYQFLFRQAFRFSCGTGKLGTPIALAALFCFTGCSSVIEAKRYKDVSLDSLKKVHVVREPNSTPGCELAAREALERRGLTVTYGLIQEKPKDADFYVELVDRWQWDLAMYLAALDIQFKDNATGELVAKGWFKQGTFHTFPDQAKKTAEVIDAIYNAPPPPQ